MPRLKCLYLEDEPQDYKFFVEVFRRELRPAQLDVEWVTTPNAAFEVLDTRGQEFQVFFADLIIDGQLQGLMAVDEAARHSGLAIIGVSEAESTEHVGAALEFERRGGHAFLNKRHIRDSEYEKGEIRKKLAEILLNNGHFLEDTLPLDWMSEEDLRLDAEIETIGEVTLRALLRQIEPGAVLFRPRFIAPGFSGAVVLQVEAMTKDRHIEQRLLVKLSKDGERLKTELERAPKEGAPSAGVYVPYLRQGPWSHRSWSALAARFEGNAVTLLEWLAARTGTAAGVARLLEELFVDGLSEAYRQSERLDVQTPLDSLYPSRRTRARVVTSNQLLVGLLPAADVHEHLHLVTAFVKYRGQIGDHPPGAMPRGATVCWSHGDLHSRNVLVVTQYARPRVIDAAERGLLHWASDPARFCVDLWLNCWDYGAASYFWASLPKWREEVGRWIDGATLPKTPDTNSHVRLAAWWMRDNLQRVSGECYQPREGDWQFSLALAIEFLVMSSYPGVPAPKRCLGLLLAEDLIARLQTNVPWH